MWNRKIGIPVHKIISVTFSQRICPGLATRESLTGAKVGLRHDEGMPSQYANYVEVSLQREMIYAALMPKELAENAPGTGHGKLYQGQVLG
ncbi:MAG TPA: hypothetical protein VKB46_07195 [Pyrinomonadaceae bacterium]|nr:hypothetical protein [Pyrinomonadaceae bacterium]